MSLTTSTHPTSTAIYVCAMTILFYDHLLTLGMEIRFIWKSPLRPLSIVFLVNRYFSIFANIVRSLTRFQTISVEKCSSVLRLRNFFISASAIFVCAFQLWRITALYNHDKRVLGSMILCVSILTFLAIWGIVSTPRGSVSDQPGCSVRVPLSVARRSGISWISIFLWDVLIICLTVAKTWRVTRDARKIAGLPFLSTLLLRDGVIYFLVMAIIYLINIPTFYSTSHAILKGTFSWLSMCVSSTMMSRLILNLKECIDARVVDGRDYDYNTVDVTMSDIVFRQLDDLELHDLGHTINPDTETSRSRYI